MAMTYAEGTALMARCRDLGRGKPIAPHTRLRWESSGAPPPLAITLYGHLIIRIYPDNTYWLASGYWASPLTKQRLNTFSPAHIAGAKLRGDLHSEWYVWHESDLITDPKISVCRYCSGTGSLAGHPEYPCGPCYGTGDRDYGSRQVPHKFHDGILVDKTGAVIDPDGRDYLARFALMSNPGKRLPPRGQ